MSLRSTFVDYSLGRGVPGSSRSDVYVVDFNQSGSWYLLQDVALNQAWDSRNDTRTHTQARTDAERRHLSVRPHRVHLHGHTSLYTLYPGLLLLGPERVRVHEREWEGGVLDRVYPGWCTLVYYLGGTPPWYTWPLWEGRCGAERRHHTVHVPE